jgi:hypothetical protein
MLLGQGYSKNLLGGIHCNRTTAKEGVVGVMGLFYLGNLGSFSLIWLML